MRSATNLAVQSVFDALRERRADTCDRREIVGPGVAHPANGPEFLQECPLLGWSDAGHIVKDRADRALGAQVLVIGHREAVRLVADALHEVEALGGAGQKDRVVAIRTEQLLPLLRQR